jgi:hypothetical protein
MPKKLWPAVDLMAFKCRTLKDKKEKIIPTNFFRIKEHKIHNVFVFIV